VELFLHIPVYLHGMDRKKITSPLTLSHITLGQEQRAECGVVGEEYV